MAKVCILTMEPNKAAVSGPAAFFGLNPATLQQQKQTEKQREEQEPVYRTSIDLITVRRNIVFTCFSFYKRVSSPKKCVYGTIG